MREYNTYNVCHGGEEMPMGYTTITCVSRFHVYTQDCLHDDKYLSCM